MLRFRRAIYAAVTMSAVVAFCAPVLAENEARERGSERELQIPFTSACVATGVPSETVSPNCNIAIPAGKRLTVEFVSAEMYFNTGKLGQLAINYMTNGTAGRQLYIPVDTGTLFGGNHTSTVSSPARISADPGTSLTIWFFAQNGSTVPFGGEGFVWITGYLSPTR